VGSREVPAANFANTFQSDLKARNADRTGSRGRNHHRAEIAAKHVMTVIAMTREIGSHGIDVAAGVAGELGLKIVNSEIVASNVASGLGVQEGTVQRYLEGSASILDRWQIDKRKLSRLTTEEVLGLARQGNVLIRGWGVAALFQDVPQVLSVRVCAPMAVRERALMERIGSKVCSASWRSGSLPSRGSREAHGFAKKRLRIIRAIQ
jgi:cytidylate kinase